MNIASPSLVEVFVHYQLPEKRGMAFVDSDGMEGGSVVSDGIRIAVLQSVDGVVVTHSAWGSPAKEGRGRPRKAGWLKLHHDEVERLHEEFGIPVSVEDTRLAYTT